MRTFTAIPIALVLLAATLAAQPQGDGALPTTVVTYRNEVSAWGAVAWQKYEIQGLFNDRDDVLLDRSRPCYGFAYTHTFADRIHDSGRRLETSQRVQPASRIGVELRDASTLAMEPDERGVEISGAVLLTPWLALGGAASTDVGKRDFIDDWNRERRPETARWSVFALEADFWPWRNLTVRERVGMGRYTRDMAPFPVSDGRVLRFTHELAWDISPSFGYSHSVVVCEWADYRSLFDCTNTIEFAIAPNITGQVSLRAGSASTTDGLDDTYFGLSCGLRAYVLPALYLDVTAAGVGMFHLFQQRDQREIRLATGMRF